MNWGQCYIDHYPIYLGEAKEQTVFRQGQGPSIQILTFADDLAALQIFCSLGLTHYHKEIQMHAEVCCPIDDGWSYVPAIIANSLFYIVQQRMSMGWGISISGVENVAPEFCRKYKKSAVYYTHPNGFPKDFSNVNCCSQEGHIYMAVFISAEEHRFFLDHGAEQLESLWEQSEIDIFELRRRSCV